MIEPVYLKEICKNYEIDYDKLIGKNDNIFNYGDYNKICVILDFLRDEVGILPKNIEKCPSILYFGKIEDIKENWQFLKEQKVTISNVENCLHVLNTDPIELRNTYNYVVENYGLRYLNAITSILRCSVSRIQEIEMNFKEFRPKNILRAAVSKWSLEEIQKIVEVCKENQIEITGNVFQKSAEEIQKIVEVCKENQIEITGSVFQKSAEEIQKIVEVCKENQIEITGSVFQKSAEEIPKIVEVCKEKQIEITGNVFKKSAEEIQKIVEVCKENKIEITGSVFLKSSKQLKENIEYIKENYGEEYLTSLIISKNNKHLKQTLPFLQEMGALEVVKSSPSILLLTIDEIKERKSFVESIGENITNPNRDKFNSIFGLSRKNYQKRVEQQMKNKNNDDGLGEQGNIR